MSPVIRNVISDDSGKGRLGCLFGTIPEIPDTAKRICVDFNPESPATGIPVPSNCNGQECAEEILARGIGGVANTTVIVAEVRAEVALLSRDGVVRIWSVKRWLQIAQVMQLTAFRAGNLLHQISMSRDASGSAERLPLNCRRSK